MERSNIERVAWLNGHLLPESEVRISFRDRGFLFGDAVFDVARTFGGRPFKLREHIERLYRSLAYVRIDPGLSLDEMQQVTEEVLAANVGLLDESTDYWIAQRVSRGVLPVEGDLSASTQPTVIVECTPIPFTARAPYFRNGIEVVVPSVRRVPPECLDPRAKSHNYLNLVIGDVEARATNPHAWAVLLDVNGNLAEGLGSNIFLVRDGALYTPRERFVLPGVSRQTVIDLARDADVPVFQQDLSLYDAYNAEEAFITSTSLCMCPVRSVNGVVYQEGKVPGALTRTLSDRYSQLVEFDFVGQYLNRLDA